MEIDESSNGDIVQISDRPLFYGLSNLAVFLERAAYDLGCFPKIGYFLVCNL